MRNCFKLMGIAATGMMLVTSATVSAENRMVSFKELQAGWHQKVIPVQEGQAKPRIDRLATAFCDAWRTSICQSVSRYLKNPKRYSSTYSRNHEIGYSIIVDHTNGSMNATDENTESPYFYATLWRRSNGHTLLGIHTGQPVDANPGVVLFYDYDPQTETLTPEKRISDYLTGRKYGQLDMTWVELPRKGKDVRVSVYGGEPAVEYTFRFNGMDFDEPVITEER